MRPIRLSMTAFGPYAGTEVVDFDALSELGLFAVAGKNGAGKTTIFDGLYFALYGSLPGRRAGYGRVRSDHAAPEIECRVEFDFLAHGRRWRIERLPKQHTAKRRGTGRTERQQRATLFDIDGDQPTAMLNRINEVNARCRELVGLSGPQFERVALLPQGEFSRLLQESSSDRRELLRALFSSDVFGDASSLLNDDASTAAASGAAVTAQLDRRQQQVADELGATDAESVTDLRARVEAVQSTTVEPARRELATLQLDAKAAEQAAHDAEHLAHRITVRTRVTARLGELSLRREEIEQDHRRLELARSAIPVVDIHRVAERQRVARTAAEQRLTEAGRVLEHALAASGVTAAVPTVADQLAPLRRLLEHEHRRETTVLDALKRAHELRAAIAELQHESQRLATSSASTGAQRDRLDTQRLDLQAAVLDLPTDEAIADLDRQASNLLEQLTDRRSLHQIEQQHDELRAQLRAAEAERVRVTEQLEDAERARARQGELNAVATTAATDLRQLTDRRDRLDRHDHLSSQLVGLRTEHDQAQQQAEALFDRFVHGAAGRLAEQLVTGEPCAVCGSSDHPQPAPHSSAPISSEQVTDARARADELGARRRSLEIDLQHLHDADPDLLAAQRTELDDTIALATEHAINTENHANENLRLASTIEALRASIADSDAHEAQLASSQREIEGHRHRLLGALGEGARTSLVELEHAASAATDSARHAQEAGGRRALLHRELRALDDNIVTIDHARVELERERSGVDAELSARRSDLEQASAGLPAPEVDHDTSVRRLRGLEQAQHALDQRGASLAEHAGADDALRRAELTVGEKLSSSPFDSVDAARAASLEPEVMQMIEATTTDYAAETNRLEGQLQDLMDLPESAPDLEELRTASIALATQAADAQQRLVETTTKLGRLTAELDAIDDERSRLGDDELAARRLERVAALVKGDNDHNTSLENWVLAAHLREVVDLANLRLAQSTQQRFQLCVLDDGEHRRGRWGLDLAVEDTVTGTRRPTAGLSGGELFQTSLALALGLADVVMNQAAGVRIDALFIDEGFGSLDDTSVERVIDLLDEVRGRGATVGVITHVAALLDVLPRGITVVARADGNGSTIQQPARAA